jgi:hypothetical protein
MTSNMRHTLHIRRGVCSIAVNPPPLSSVLTLPTSPNGPMDAETTSHFEKDLRDVHIVYDYNVRDASSGTSEKWRYEFWFFSSDRVVYKIHGGPMAGRSNYQACSYQCIRPGELWQCNWLEGALNPDIYARQQTRIDKVTQRRGRLCRWCMT